MTTEEKEVWRDVVGYEDYYEVSSLGNVRRKDGIISCVVNGVPVKKKWRGRMMKLRLDSKGYMRVCLCVGNKKKDCAIHRIVATAFMPNPENKPEVNHIDGHRSNNAVSNLEWATRGENELHAFRVLGKQPNKPWDGKRRDFARLFTVEDIKAIRSDTRPSRAIAKDYGTTKTTILNIKNNKIYTEEEYVNQ